MSDKWLITSRVVAAIFIGYALTIIVSMFLSQILHIMGMQRIGASLTAMMFSFVIYTAIVMWIFSAKAVTEVWVKLISALTLTGGLVWIIRFWSFS